MKFPRRSLLKILALLVATLGLHVFGAESPWQRVVVIGASASAGFVFSEPFGGGETTRCKLNYYLDAAIATPHPPVKNLATALVFMNPESLAPLQIEAATNARPTLVIGVDFLFWFCYGDASDDAARARRFEHGLKLLDQIHCPLVVGDIPDASCATNTGIIGSRQVPDESARHAANRRLKEWAAAHPQVVLVPLANFMHDMMANADVKLHGKTLPAGRTRALLQADQLHPNPRGAAVLALCILDALVSSQPEFPAADVRWNPAEVFRIGCKSAALAGRPRQAGE